MNLPIPTYGTPNLGLPLTRGSDSGLTAASVFETARGDLVGADVVHDPREVAQAPVAIDESGFFQTYAPIPA